MEREYDQECEHITGSHEQRRVKLVRRLLVEDVDPLELKELKYEVGSSWHLGVIATGAKSWDLIQSLETIGGRNLLSVPGDEGAVWVWLGGQAELTVAEFTRLLSANGRPDASLAIGEPRSGLEGWRETHREAQVALLVARHEQRGLTRCADALPVAGALQSKAIITMYEKTYVLPLNKLRKGGRPAREALRAYFKYGRNASTAGKAINVSRRTVENCLKEARKVLGDPLNLTGLEIALRLEELGYMAKKT
jgi:GGDEF-like domain